MFFLSLIIIKINGRNVNNYLIISASKDAMSSENKYGGLLTKAEAELQRLSRVSPSLKKKKENTTFLWFGFYQIKVTVHDYTDLS